MRTPWIWVASLSGASGVVLGAFGAHALRARLPADKLASWTTAVEYQLLHSVALLALALWAAASGRAVTLPAALFSAGIVLFSGSIYEDMAGYARAVVVGDRIFVSGTVGVDFATGARAEGAEAQTTQALDTIEAALTEASSGLWDITRFRVYAM